MDTRKTASGYHLAMVPSTHRTLPQRLDMQATPVLQTVYHAAHVAEADSVHMCRAWCTYRQAGRRMHARQRTPHSGLMSTPHAFDVSSPQSLNRWTWCHLSLKPLRKCIATAAAQAPGRWPSRALSPPAAPTAARHARTPSGRPSRARLATLQTAMTRTAAASTPRIYGAPPSRLRQVSYLHCTAS